MAFHNQIKPTAFHAEWRGVGFHHHCIFTAIFIELSLSVSCEFYGSAVCSFNIDGEAGLNGQEYPIISCAHTWAKLQYSIEIRGLG